MDPGPRPTNAEMAQLVAMVEDAGLVEVYEGLLLGQGDGPASVQPAASRAQVIAARPAFRARATPLAIRTPRGDSDRELGTLSPAHSTGSGCVTT